ncbi:uncharacterized protein V1518DRAFT_363836, partial [Limtongia smithiae]|uniref:uncharacterized protein n=1 Tax=Limtongia smithiae TaxID=1125753 RepID=UPI0034CF5BC0
SSASTTTSRPFRYANATDLPSHPSVGIAMSESNSAALLARNAPENVKPMWQPSGISHTASSAATLAAANGPQYKEFWRPDPSTSAELSAILSKDPKYNCISSSTASTHSRPPSIKVSATGAKPRSVSIQHSRQARAATPPLSPRAAAVSGDFLAPPQAHRRKHGAPPTPPSELESPSLASSSQTKPSRQPFAGSTGLPETKESNLGSLPALEETPKRTTGKRTSQIYAVSPTLVSTGSRRVASDSVTAQSGAESASRRLQIMHDMQLEHERLVHNKESRYDAVSRYEILLAAAQNNVNKEMGKIDKNIRENTVWGNKEYNAIALAIAEQEIHGARSQNSGKIDIGGGRFMTAEEVQEIAKKHVQPVLDELHEKAMEQREKDENARIEKERKLAEKAEEKARLHAIKMDEKARKKEEKADKKMRKEAEKARKQDDKMRLK